MAILPNSCSSRSTALVIGGLGFLGSRVVVELDACGIDAVIVDCQLHDGGANVANYLDWATERQLPLFTSLEQIPKGFLPSMVINVAGRTSHRGSMMMPVDDAQSNVSDQLRILEFIRLTCPDSRIIFTSTRQVYGSPKYLPVDEFHPVCPPDVNAINKFAAEQHHRLYARVYGLDCTILRLTNCFGPGMRIRDSRQGFVGEWIRRSLTGEPLRLFGGRQVRDFLYGDDAAKAIVQAAQSADLSGGTYNIGGAESLTLQELADVWTRLVPGTSIEVEPMPADLAAIEVGETRLDDSRFRAATGWAPQTSVSQGLAKTLAYYREHLKEYL